MLTRTTYSEMPIRRGFSDSGFMMQGGKWFPGSDLLQNPRPHGVL